MKIVLLVLCFTVIVSAQEDTTVVSSPEEIIKYLPENTPEERALKDTIVSMYGEYSSAEDDAKKADLLLHFLNYLLDHQQWQLESAPNEEKKEGRFTYKFKHVGRWQDKPSASSKAVEPESDNEVPVEDNPGTIAIIHFEYRSAVIPESGCGLLNEMADTMKAHPGYKWQIAGHVDLGEDTNQNKALAIERALIVKKYFIAKGIDQRRLKIEFTGKDKFADETFNEEGKGAKRRVVISRLK